MRRFLPGLLFLAIVITGATLMVVLVVPYLTCLFGVPTTCCLGTRWSAS